MGTNTGDALLGNESMMVTGMEQIKSEVTQPYHRRQFI